VRDALPTHRRMLVMRLEQKIQKVTHQYGGQPGLWDVQMLLLACPVEQIDELFAERSHEAIVAF